MEFPSFQLNIIDSSLLNLNRYDFFIFVTNSLVFTYEAHHLTTVRSVRQPSLGFFFALYFL